ncbi:DUF488 domain-containing protein [Legionella clemsonensis]|uniref:Uroporphyrin-III C-methyltransferase n=1 Tax=Legionella clemsonensis TaxID=1867846 RepID=A0A222P5H6_9GAMM|nr:DUF488 family protein [Legionella clemsonensis]ASQ47067.1 hypothetical protein clem_12660 [Legionella clemsonensis]
MTANEKNIKICRAYEPPEIKDGLWFLVDRLWPRGLKKDKLPIDAWLKEIAPSPELRKWFNHEPEKWLDFASRYIDELRRKQELVEEILTKAKNKEVVLFYAAKDKQHNHARVLKAFLDCWPKTPQLDSLTTSSHQ